MNQSYKEIEYIIIDGVSKDKTVEIAKSYLEKFNAIPGRSMKIISEPDKGMYDALNKGARLANGVIVGQINADDWYYPDAAKAMAELYEREKFNVAWGSTRIITGKKTFIKHAGIHTNILGLKLWSSTHWNHTSQFTERKILLEYPYILENVYDDFDFLTKCYVNGKKCCVTDEMISNFQFGGMSNKKSLKDTVKRVNYSYKIYRRYGFSRFYYFYKFVYEMLKYIMA